MTHVPKLNSARALLYERSTEYVSPLATPNMVTFAGDWHGEAWAADKTIAWAAYQGSQVILHTGDFGVWSGSGGQFFLKAVSAALVRHNLSLIFVDGNHEDFDLLYEYPINEFGLRPILPRLYHAPRGFRWKWNDVRFLALGGATSLDKPHRMLGVSWWPQEELTYSDCTKAIDGGEADVMITHDCPAGVSIPGIPDEPTHSELFSYDEIVRAHSHRRTLRAVVDEVQPTHLYHGHFHRKYVQEVRFGDGPMTRVTGLDCNNDIAHSYVSIPLWELASEVLERRAAEPVLEG